MRCPHCEQNLAACDYESSAVHTCEGCHGEFVSSASLRDIVNQREQLFPSELLERFASSKPQFEAPEEGRSVACPSCDLPMSPIIYACDTGVIVDRCDSCGGVWLDADELEAIQIILERWEDAAPQQIGAISKKLTAAKARASKATQASGVFSRYGFIDAMIARVINRAA